jgi:DNA-directed RNA polymerase specialized sigma24 family protein
VTEKLIAGSVDVQHVVRRSYASRREFCAAFMEDMNSLYTLALLLTADHGRAEQCFVSALDDCLKGPDVFPDKVRSWCRRAIVKQAIQVVGPRPEVRSDGPALADGAITSDSSDSLNRLMQLRTFERFVLTVAVLEQYSVRECAALLGCSVRAVEWARLRALRALGRVNRDAQAARSTVRRSQQPVLVPSIGVAV